MEVQGVDYEAPAEDGLDEIVSPKNVLFGAQSKDEYEPMNSRIYSEFWRIYAIISV